MLQEAVISDFTGLACTKIRPLVGRRQIAVLMEWNAALSNITSNCLFDAFLIHLYGLILLFASASNFALEKFQTWMAGNVPIVVA
jgi:hypothetical protein